MVRFWLSSDDATSEHEWMQPRFDVKPTLRSLAIAIAFFLALQFGLLERVLPVFEAAQETADDIADQLLELSSGLLLDGSSDSTFAFIEIDQETFETWGSPNLTPRDQLARIIAFSVYSDARMILIDIDLSWEGDPEQDAFLADVVSSLGADAPPIIFSRRLVDNWGTEKPYPSMPPTAFDDLFTSLPNVHFASSLFEVDPDMSIRRWRLWDVACGEKGPLVIPSVQLLSAALLYAPVDGAEQLERSLTPLTPEDCQQPAPEQKVPFLVKVSGPEAELAVRSDDLRQRLIYTMPWHLESDGEQQFKTINGESVPLILSIPAGIVSVAEEPVPDLLAGRIVMIGAGHSESRDVFNTPLGFMPGAMILLNSVHAASIMGGHTALSDWAEAGITLCIIVLLILLFNVFRQMVAGILALVILPAIYIYSLSYLPNGQMIHFITDATIVFVFAELAEFLVVTVPSDFGQHGWRLIFNSEFRGDDEREWPDEE